MALSPKHVAMSESTKPINFLSAVWIINEDEDGGNATARVCQKSISDLAIFKHPLRRRPSSVRLFERFVSFFFFFQVKATFESQLKAFDGCSIDIEQVILSFLSTQRLST